MSNKLEVQIGADVKELQSKLNNAEKSLKNFSNKADSNLNSFSKSSKTASKSLSGLNKGAISGNSAMTAFSRTVQDAPFGIMGVSNNITNLTEQFGYLKNKTGSSGGALKAMLKDLKGFGGITLGISVATSLLLVFGDKIFKTKDKVKELRKEQEDLTKSLDNYVFSLEAVNKANLKGAQSGQKEIVRLGLLRSQINNTTLSVDKRKNAINELRKKYPAYLKDMTNEKILNGGLESTYKSLTTSILQRAKATASMNAIIKNSEQLLIIENQLANKKDEIAKKTIALQNATTIAQARAGKERSGTNFSIQTQIQLQEELNKLNSESNKLIGQKQNLELSNIDLEQNVSNLGGIAELVVPKNTGEKINEKLEEVKPLIGKGISNLNEFIKEQPVSILGSGLTQLEADALIFKERLLMFQQDVANMLGQASEMGFNSFGESIGGALSNGTSVLKAAGASLLGTLGDIMVKYGQLAIAFGLASEAVASVFKNPFGGGVAAIIGGTALVAIGSAIKGFSSNVSSGGSGGATTSNAGSSSSSGGSSFSSGGSGLSSGSQNVVFQIQGTKLVGVLSNTLAQNRALGGNLSII